MLKAHFIDVGHGNMVLALLPDGEVFLFDCNVTTGNEDRVMRYLYEVIPKYEIDFFVNTHREADHFRGIKNVHENFPISTIWDSGITGTSPDEPSYQNYMDLRRQVGYQTIKAKEDFDFGDVRLRCMNAARDDTEDVNSQSLVFKIEYGESSLMLTGDTDYPAWRDFITRNYSDSYLKSQILLASHHGAITFFEDPYDDEHHYTSHLKKINPDMVVVSVGENDFGHPDPKAIEYYEKYSKGSNKGNHVVTTEEKGNIKVTFDSAGSWKISYY